MLQLHTKIGNRRGVSRSYKKKRQNKILSILLLDPDPRSSCRPNGHNPNNCLTTQINPQKIIPVTSQTISTASTTDTANQVYGSSLLLCSATKPIPVILPQPRVFVKDNKVANMKNCIEIKTQHKTHKDLSTISIPTILVCNIRSSALKIDELGCVINLNSADVICVTETWLSEEISDSYVSLPNFLGFVKIEQHVVVELPCMLNLLSSVKFLI